MYVPVNLRLPIYIVVPGLLALSAILFLPMTAFFQSTEGTAKLELQIVDADGKPVKLAKVVLNSASQKQQSLSETKNGTYKATPQAGIYHLVISKKGFCPDVRGAFEIKASDKILLTATLFSCKKKDKMVHPGAKVEILSATYDLPFKEDSIRINGGRFNVQVKYGSRV